MKEIFVPYEIATKLKEIGFDEPCVAIYSIHDNELKGIIQGEEKLTDNFILGKFTCSSYSGIPAPTWEQVFKWFREKGIICSINPRLYANLFFYEIFVKENGEAKRTYIGNENMSYEECREKLILKMIKIYENNKI